MDRKMMNHAAFVRNSDHPAYSGPGDETDHEFAKRIKRSMVKLNGSGYSPRMEPDCWLYYPFAWSIFNSLAAAFETPAKPRPRMTIADADRELRRQIGMHFPVWATLARRKLAARQKVMIVLDGLECCVHGQATGHRHKKTRKEVIRYADPLTGKPKRIALDPSKILIGEIRERR